MAFKPPRSAKDSASDRRVNNTSILTNGASSVTVVPSMGTLGPSVAEATLAKTTSFFRKGSVSPFGTDTRKELRMLFVDICSLSGVRYRWQRCIGPLGNLPYGSS